MRFRSLLTLLLAIVAATDSPVAGAAPVRLFSQAGPHAPPDPGPRHRFVHVDAALLDSEADVELNLFDDVTLFSSGARAAARANGLRSWSSAIEGDRFGMALFVARGGRVLGHVEAEGSVFEIRPVAGDLHEIRELDLAALPSEAEPVRPPGERTDGAAAAPGRSVSRDSVDSIRVLLVYTPAAAAASADIEAEAQLAIDAANTAYQNSGMLTRLELIATTETTYTETDDIYADLDWLAGRSDGVMDEVHGIRNAYLADFVGLLIEGSPDYCGLAALMTSVSPAFEDQAFSVTYRPCAVGNLTLAHELGHNMGCQHDRGNATSVPAYTWAYGYQDPEGDFRTVMAVAAGCAVPDCVRVAHFANPQVFYLGDPTGIDAGEPDAAACAMAIDSSSTVTCDFRTLAPPGMLEASSTFTDRIRVEFDHPWPWSFQVYRAESGGPMTALETTPDSPFDDTTAAVGTSYDYWVSTLSAVDGESSVAGPVTGMRIAPVCGNGTQEWPAEECDDGGLEAGDGCAPDCTNEVPLEDVAADCVAAINDRASRVAKTQGKENLVCLMSAAAGSQPDADACIAADTRSKVAKARAKVVSADEAFCTLPPPYLYTGATTASDAAENERRAFLLDLFGADLSAAVVSKQADAAAARCQKGFAKAADKLVATEIATFLACKKDRLKSGTVSAANSVAHCFEEVAAEAASEGTKLSSAFARIGATRVKNCSASSLDVLFPGECAGAVDTAFDGCVAASSSCRTCRFFNLADGLSHDCDLFDNESADSSCPP